MNIIIVVFRARSHTINFANILKSYSVPCEIITTPRKVNVSCGISVKFNPQFLSTVEQVLSRRNFDTFAGIYQLTGLGNTQKVIRIK